MLQTIAVKAIEAGNDWDHRVFARINLIMEKNRKQVPNPHEVEIY